MPLAINAGDLDTRVRFERPVESDALGEAGVGSWETVFVRWASVVDAIPSRSEQQADGQLQRSNRTRVRIRYTDGISADFRIAIGSLNAPDAPRPANRRYLAIVGGPAILGHREWIEVTAEEYGTQGSGV